MNNESWVIIDTETSGMMPPVCAVEIAGQRMKGWGPDGSPFRVLLNHDGPIDPMAQSVHGYSREFLRQNGQDPRKAHKAFHALPTVPGGVMRSRVYYILRRNIIIFAVATLYFAFSLSAFASLSNPFETIKKLNDYDKQARVAIQSEKPVYFPLIRLNDSEREYLYLYLRDKLQKPLKIYQLALLDYPRLRLLRNAIYAHHGRKFIAPDLDAFFRHTSWYAPSLKFNDALLTPVERENVELMLRLETLLFRRNNDALKRLKFSCANGHSSLPVPEVNGRVSINFDTCDDTTQGRTTVQDHNGKIRFSASFGGEGGMGSIKYYIPQWGNNLVAWIYEAHEREEVYDKLVVLSQTGEPLADVHMPAETILDPSYGGTLHEFALVAPDVLFISASSEEQEEQNLIFLKKRLKFAPRVMSLYRWRAPVLSSADIEPTCEQTAPKPSVTPIENPVVLWDKTIKSASFPIAVKKNIIFFAAPDTATGGKSMDYRLIALDKLTGKEQWEQDLGGRVRESNVQGDLLAIATSFRLAVISGSSGKWLWNVENQVRRDFDNTGWDDGTALFFSGDHLVEAVGSAIDLFDVASGKRERRIDLLQNKQTKRIPFHSGMWHAYAGNLYYSVINEQAYVEDGYDKVRATVYLAALQPSGKVLWTYSAAVTPFGTGKRIYFSGCSMYVIDVKSVIKVDLATGKSAVINRKPDSRIIDYQAELLLPFTKTYSWSMSALNFKLNQADTKPACVTTSLNEPVIYIIDGWPTKAVLMRSACPKRIHYNNDYEFNTLWSTAPWDQKKDFGNLYPNIDPMIMHADHYYLLIKTSDHYWAIGEEALADSVHNILNPWKKP